MFSLRDLECFMAVVEHKTFSRAAQSLHMAQPPLSRRIAELERDVGTPLFVRGSRQVQLTQSGLSLAREAQIVLQQARLAERIVRESLSGNMGHLRLGYVGSAGFDVVPRAIRILRDQNPHASVSLSHVWIHQSDALRVGTIDIALIGGVTDTEGFRADVIGEGRLVAALLESHPLAERSSVTVEELAKEPFVELPRYGPTGMHDLVRSVFAGRGAVPRVVQVAEGHDMLIACVAAGLGVSLVNSAAVRLPVPRVVYRPIVPESPPVRLTALSRESEKNPLVGLFVEALKAVYTESV